MSDPIDRDRQQRELTEELRHDAELRAQAKHPQEAGRRADVHAEAMREQSRDVGERARQLHEAEEASKVTITLPDGPLTITIASASDALASPDLIQRAIVGLIECTHTYGGALAHDQAALNFYTAILSALARHYAADYPPARDMPIYELLDALINDLRDDDRLRYVVHAPQA
jgi:hypothetical protein